VIGALPTVALVVLTALIGVALLRQQGIATIQRLQAQLDQGVLPAAEMIEGVILLVSGALLLTPGVATDLIGFLCLVPALRQAMAQRLIGRAFVFGGTAASKRPPGADDASKTIEGEFTREDDH
jgi:UPF0716 protein FxsA